MFRYPLTRYERVTAVEWSLCAAKNSSCSKMNCPSDVDEMCGNDGVTYDNACHLRKATCTSGVQLSHVGACTDLSVIEKKSDCPKKCDSGDEDVDEVVCGSDGNVYRFVASNLIFRGVHSSGKTSQRRLPSLSGQCVSYGRGHAVSAWCARPVLTARGPSSATRTAPAAT